MSLKSISIFGHGLFLAAPTPYLSLVSRDLGTIEVMLLLHVLTCTLVQLPCFCGLLQMKERGGRAREENAKWQTRCSRSDRVPRLERDGERVEPGLQKIEADRGEIEVRQSAQSTAARGGYRVPWVMNANTYFSE